MGLASETPISFNGFLRNLRTSFSFCFGARETQKQSMIFFSSSEKSGITLSVYALSTPHVVTLYFPCFCTVQLDPKTLGFNTVWLFCIKPHRFSVQAAGRRHQSFGAGAVTRL